MNKKQTHSILHYTSIANRGVTSPRPEKTELQSPATTYTLLNHFSKEARDQTPHKRMGDDPHHILIAFTQQELRRGEIASKQATLVRTGRYYLNKKAGAEAKMELRSACKRASGAEKGE